VSTPDGIRLCAISRAISRASCFALLATAALLVSAPHARAKSDPMLDFLMEQAAQDAGPGLVSNVIDYVALRTAMLTAPDILRRRLRACGTCANRAQLEADLAMAERDKTILEAMEGLIGRTYGMDPWTAWKIGIRIRPDQVMKEPQACIMLYDRGMDCAVRLDDRRAGQPGKACYPEYHLQELCAAGNPREFYAYVDFLRKKQNGETVSETVGRETYYYNTRATTKIAMPATLPPNEPFLAVTTDLAAPGLLRRAEVAALGLSGPLLRFARDDQFREPWRTIVRQDNAAVSAGGRVLECTYLIANSANVDAFLFWYRERPPRAEPAALTARMEHHPLLRVGPPVAECPANVAAARALNPFIPTETLEHFYAGKLN
jgi:hypothetical protein